MLKHLQSRVAAIVAPAIHPDDAQPMVINVWSVGRSTSLEMYADAEEAEWSTT